MSTDCRQENGRFAPGNPGGPGRPRRAIEREYLAALSDAVTVADWREVVDRAVADAKAGDAKAREWLSRYLLGAEPSTLLRLAANEQRGVTADLDIEAEQANQQREAERQKRLDAILSKLS